MTQYEIPIESKKNKTCSFGVRMVGNEWDGILYWEDYEPFAQCPVRPLHL